MKFYVYSALNRDYDFIRWVPPTLRGKARFLLFSEDIKRHKVNGWEVINPKVKISDSQRLARYVKIMPHEFLGDGISMWVDANISFGADLIRELTRFEQSGSVISVCKHPVRSCVFDEAQACIDLGKGSEISIRRQIDSLLEQGYPPNKGLAETNVLLRRHSNRQVIKAMENWWELLDRYSTRDQLSFGVACHEAGIDPEYLSINPHALESGFRRGLHRRNSLVINVFAYLEALQMVVPGGKLAVSIGYRLKKLVRCFSTSE